MMKKLFLLAAVVALVMLVASPAYAINFGNQGSNHHNDYSTTDNSTNNNSNSDSSAVGVGVGVGFSSADASNSNSVKNTNKKISSGNS